MFDIINVFEFYVSCIIKCKRDAKIWRFFFVYESAYDEHKVDFIYELHGVFSCWSGPTLIGSDFNLIRESKVKNNGNINQHWSNLFNDLINKLSLIEVKKWWPKIKFLFLLVEKIYFLM
jgi:hypothetical protein